MFRSVVKAQSVIAPILPPFISLLQIYAALSRHWVATLQIELFVLEQGPHFCTSLRSCHTSHHSLAVAYVKRALLLHVSY